MTEVRRDHYGRYLITPEGGTQPEPHTRCTTIAKALDDTTGIAKWKMRHAAKGLAQRPDLLALVAATPLESKSALDRTCDDAVEAAAASSRANIGTALHSFTEGADLGASVDLVPPPWNKDIAAYLACRKQNTILVVPDRIEVIAVCTKLDELVAGTIDRIVMWRGRNYIADIKTGTDLKYSWRSIACQLAIYSRSESIYDPKLDEHHVMPVVEQDLGIVFHLPAGGGVCKAYTVDLDAGWEGAQQAVAVRAWRKRKDLHGELAA